MKEQDDDKKKKGNLEVQNLSEEILQRAIVILIFNSIFHEFLLFFIFHH